MKCGRNLPMFLWNLQNSSSSALKMEAVSSFEKLYISTNVSGDVQEEKLTLRYLIVATSK